MKVALSFKKVAIKNVQIILNNKIDYYNVRFLNNFYLHCSFICSVDKLLSSINVAFLSKTAAIKKLKIILNDKLT